MKAQGYPHSATALRKHLKASTGKKQADLLETSLLDRFSAKKAVWLFIRSFSDLKEEEREELVAIRQASAVADTMYQLVQEFLRIVHKLQGGQLDAWIAEAHGERDQRATTFPQRSSTRQSGCVNGTYPLFQQWTNRRTSYAY